MIENDRVELNNRFKIIYELLKEKGEIVKSHPNKSKAAFAKRLLGSKQYGHIISQFLNDKRYIDYKHINILAQEYDVNREYMRTGEGDYFGNDKPERYRNDNVTPIPSASGSILYTTARAFAGFTMDVGSFAGEENFFFNMPGVSGKDMVAFNVEGNSMEPILQEGDMIICKPVENLNEIKDKAIYAVKHDGQLWVKHVNKIVKGSKDIQLELVSANYLDHPPFTESVNDTTKLFKVVRKVSNL